MRRHPAPAQAYSTDTTKLKKHISLVLERLSRTGTSLTDAAANGE